MPQAPTGAVCPPTIGFSLTGVQTGVAEERTNVDTISKSIKADVKKASSLFGRARQHQDSGIDLYGSGS